MQKATKRQCIYWYQTKYTLGKKSITEEFQAIKDGHFIMTKGSTHEQDVWIIVIYARKKEPQNRWSKKWQNWKKRQHNK